MKIENKTVLITGGSGGIGLEFAKQLAQLGNQVIVTGRNSEKLGNVRRKFPQIQTSQSISKNILPSKIKQRSPLARYLK